MTQLQNLCSLFADHFGFTVQITAKLWADRCYVTDIDSPGGGCVIGQKCGAVALPSEAVSGLVVTGDHGLGLSLGFALLWHGSVPLTPSLLQPASSQTPLLQVDPAQLIVYG